MGLSVVVRDDWEAFGTGWALGFVEWCGLAEVAG